MSVPQGNLSQTQIEKIQSALTPKWTEFIPHSPTIRQHVALLLDDTRELLYGGAAGGGKSDYLLMGALQYVDVPNYAALILRRTFPQLSQSDGLLERAADWLTGKAEGTDSISGLPTKWTFPSGATLTLAHCQHDKDRFNFQGGAWQFIGFDELTQFSSRIYLYLFSRLRRTTVISVPLRMRGASNPGGVGHDWVKARFIDQEGFLPSQAKAVFLPSKLSDNPHLDREAYEESLSHLASTDRAQLLEGDWDVRPEGGRFKREWFGPALDITPKCRNRVRRWDIAATEPRPGTDPDWCIGLQLDRDAKSDFEYVQDVIRVRTSPANVENLIVDTAKRDGPDIRVRIEQEPGSAGKLVISTFQRLLPGFDVQGIPSTGDKLVRALPAIAYAERGRIKLKKAPWNEAFLRELERYTGDPSEDVHDDQVDALSGSHRDVNFDDIGAVVWGSSRSKHPRQDRRWRELS